MAISKLNPSAGGIPFGDTAGRPTGATGKLYSNGETARLELYTSGGAWENIVQEVPGVSGISGTYSESANSGTITINGTNFVSGAIASATGTNSVEVQASSTTYNSLVQLTAVFAGLSNAYEPYDIKVTNPSNLFGLIPDALYINASPVWQTVSGSLGTFLETLSMSVNATATDSDSTITYSLASGSTLPSGVTLNSSTGLISGTLPEIATDTTYSFTINASDGVNPVVPRAFSFISLNLITVPSVEYLVVAGGGGAGANGGYGSGGGAGGFRYGSISPVSATEYSIVVGLGGTGQVGAGADNSTVGGVSTFASITSAGGGRGRGVSGGVVGLPGGSGSGGDRQPGGASSPVTSPVQGFAGGAGGNESTGGGGGAGGVGVNGGDRAGGAGGPGAQSSITGIATFYAGGGGGAAQYNGGLGGSSIGGNAGNEGQPGTDGVANTGSGGGGGGSGFNNGGNGGSGVVIFAYTNNSNYRTPTISAGLTYTLDTATRSGYRVYRFTAGSGTVTF
jgi:hypothetical protein